MPSDAFVHIIDDDAAVRDSLSFLLKMAGIGVALYASAEEFLAGMPGVGGCVVTDIRMPGMTGLELLRRLHDDGVKVPVIVVTGHADVPLAVEAMKLGAVEFLEKPFDESSILAAVRAALDRGHDEGERSARGQEVRAMMDALTPRERQVLDGLVAGNPNKTIAYDLGISPRTVEIYRANVMTKMHARSLSELVRMVLTAADA